MGTWQVKGIRQPDSIGAYEVAGQTYVVTANEADARLKDLNAPTHSSDSSASVASLCTTSLTQHRRSTWPMSTTYRRPEIWVQRAWRSSPRLIRPLV
ncbi:choice-of-anchor I domain-containing protein [Corynebacterium cystitidis]|uniref:choice-of-anchor I domain-containing protein n=1 Tax=Corynebacterium cystitidis TaxID=35757 RepID=UPI0038B99E17